MKVVMSFKNDTLQVPEFLAAELRKGKKCKDSAAQAYITMLQAFIEENVNAVVVMEEGDLQ